MQRIIGGMMSLAGYQRFPFKKMENSIYMVNARSCFHFLLSVKNPKKVWLPNYICDSMVQGECNFYPVNNDLKSCETEWISQVSAEDLVVFVDYFGFAFDKQIKYEVSRTGATVVSDFSHSIFSTPEYDFSIYSLTKQLGLPDGGILVGLSDDSSLVNLPKNYVDRMLSLRNKRHHFDLGFDNNWYEDYLQTRDLSPTGSYRISDFSLNNIHLPSRESLVDNYNEYYKELYEFSLMGQLFDNVPMCFPILCKNRDSLRSALFKENIFPPVYWLNDKIPPLDLSFDMMALPCDPRYTKDDIQRVITCVKNNSN